MSKKVCIDCHILKDELDKHKTALLKATAFINYCINNVPEPYQFDRILKEIDDTLNKGG